MTADNKQNQIQVSSDFDYYDCSALPTYVVCVPNTKFSADEWIEPQSRDIAVVKRCETSQEVNMTFVDDYWYGFDNPDKVYDDIKLSLVSCDQDPVWNGWSFIRDHFSSHFDAVRHMCANFETKYEYYIYDYVTRHPEVEMLLVKGGDMKPVEKCSRRKHFCRGNCSFFQRFAHQLMTKKICVYDGSQTEVNFILACILKFHLTNLDFCVDDPSRLDREDLNVLSLGYIHGRSLLWNDRVWRLKDKVIVNRHCAVRKRHFALKLKGSAEHQVPKILGQKKKMRALNKKLKEFRKQVNENHFDKKSQLFDNLFGIQDLANSMNNFTGMAPHLVHQLTQELTDTFDSLLGGVKQMLNEFASKIGLTLNVVDILATLALLWRVRDDKVAMGLAITSYLTRYGLQIPDLGFLFNYSQVNEDASANLLHQTIVKYVPMLGIAMTILLIPFSVKSVPSNLGDLADTLRTITTAKLGEFGRAIDGWHKLQAVWTTVSTTIASYIVEWIYGVKVLSPEQKVLDTLKEWITKLNKYEKMETRHAAVVDRQIINELESDLAKVQAFLLENPQLKGKTEYDLLQALRTNLFRVHTSMVETMDTRAKTRMEPLGILLYGKPGVGKSQLTDLLVTQLTKQHNKLVEEHGAGDKYNLDYANLQQSKYTFNPANEFWDGYKRQFAVIFDDFAQVVDSSAKANPEFQEMIRCVNVSEYTVHSAHLAEKGKVKFDSKALIASSNTLTFDIRSISSRDALYRRFAVIAQFRVKPQFATPQGSVDKSKVDGFDPNIYDIDLYRWYDVSDKSKPPKSFKTVDFKTFGQYVLTAYRDRFEKFYASQANLGDFSDIFDGDDAEARSAYYSQIGEEEEFADALSVEEYHYLTISDCFEEIKKTPGSIGKICMSFLMAAEYGLDKMEQIHLWLEEGEKWKYFLGTIGLLGLMWFWKRWRTEECKNCSIYANSKRTVEDLLKYVNHANHTCQKCAAIKASLEEQVTQASDQFERLSTEIVKDEVSFAVADKVRRQMYVVYNSDKTRKFVFTMIKGRVALMNNHCAQWMKDQSFIYVRGVHSSTFQKLMVSDFLFHGDGVDDIMLVTVPTNLPYAKDITNLFQDRKEICRYVNAQFTFVSLTDSNTIMVGVHREGQLTGYDTPSSIDNGAFYLRTSYQYTMDTNPGDCGALLVVNNKAFQKKICAMHTFGGIRNGATPVFKHRLDALLADIPLSSQINMVYENIVEQEVQLVHVDEPIKELPMIGIIPDPPYQNTKTDIHPSPLQGKIKDVVTHCLPAVLHSKTDPPMTKGLKKVANAPDPVEKELIQICIDHYFSGLPSSDIQRVLTEEEMIQGIPGRMFKPVSRTTSAGYPWKGSKGKAKWLGEDEYKYDLELKNAVDQREEAARNGIRKETIWIDTLKDERRPIEKVNANKTRVFSVGPQDFTLLFRKYFGAFCNMLAENRVYQECCVGVNPYHEWWMIATYLQQVGDNCVAGDFSNYDGSILADVMHLIGKAIDSWYGDGHTLVREVLFADIYNSVHSAGGLVYQWTHSNPSGQPMTAVINSIFNSVMCRYVFVKATGLPLQKWDEFVRMVSYGDDNLLSIHDSIKHKFNQVTMTREFAKLGMTYTNETKTGEIVPTRPLHECNFLKRGFRKDCGVWLAPLAIETITEMVQWLRKSADVVGDTKVNVETALMELSLHTPYYWERYSTLIMNACKEQGIPVKRYAQAHVFDTMFAAGLRDLDETDGLSPVTAVVQEEPEPIFTAQVGRDKCETRPQKYSQFRRILAKGREALRPKESTLTDLPMTTPAASVNDEKQAISFAFLQQLINSSDPKTARMLRNVDCIRVVDNRPSELNSSGDPHTRRVVRSVELNSSGDPHTKKVVRSVEMETDEHCSKSVSPVSCIFTILKQYGLSKLASILNEMVSDSLHVLVLSIAHGMGKRVRIARFPLMPLVSPIVEEIVTSSFRLNFGLYEYTTKISRANGWNIKLLTALAGLPALGVHALAEWMVHNHFSLLSRIAMHFIYNSMVSHLHRGKFNELCRCKWDGSQLRKCRLCYVDGTCHPANMSREQLEFYLSAMRGDKTQVQPTPDTVDTVDEGQQSVACLCATLDDPPELDDIIEGLIPDTVDTSLALCATLEGSDNILSSDNNVVQPNETSNQLTEFSDTPIVEQPLVVKHKEVSGSMDNLMESLTRPYLLKTVMWSTSQGAGEDLLQIVVPDELMERPFYKLRMSFMRYLKCGVKFIVMVNGTKWTTGQVYCYFNPAGTESDVFGKPKEVAGFTGFPGVKVKAQVGSQGEFTVPWSFLTKSKDMISGDGTLGLFVVSVINPLRTGGSLSEIGVSVYTQLVNPQLRVHSGSPIATFDEVLGGISKFIKPVTQTLDAFGVPLVGEIGSTVGTVLNSMGFSKPSNELPVQPVHVNFSKYWPNFSGIDNSVVLGQGHSSDAGYISSGFYEGDEMSLANLKAQMCLFKTIEWSAKENAGAILSKIEMPLLKDDAFDFLSFIGNMTLMYTGPQNIMLETINSLTQSGRLRVSVGPPDEDVTPENLNNLPSFIVDLQAQENEHYFEAPFLVNRQWLFTEYPSCVIYISVVNPLVTADSSDICDINLWRWGSQKLRFTVPTPLHKGISQMRADDKPVSKLVDFQDGNIDFAVVDELTSLREYIKRPQMIYSQTLGNGDTICIKPYHFGGVEQSPMDIAAHIFRFFRGSIRYKIISDQNLGTLTAWLGYGEDDDKDRITIQDVDVPRQALASVVTNSSINPLLELEVPWYNEYHMQFLKYSWGHQTAKVEFVPRLYVQSSIPKPTGDVDSGIWTDVTAHEAGLGGGGTGGQLNFTVLGPCRFDITNVDPTSDDLVIQVGRGAAPTAWSTVYESKTATPLVLQAGIYTISSNKDVSVKYTLSYSVAAGANVQIWISAGDDMSFLWLVPPTGLVPTPPK
ncbi:hypothetical protein [Beihai mantis shrimp virus 3]|uniref:hypothetical protein n=1 Tax=Beihai mantis shrimp virus 3 TaxID=1922430 RepID=UPI00090BA5A7|nr:hypothetical protein [Beihai mantis shrimp virus 3]APG78875.1 hypothetical protein [Beihai mantis shrimp virus 3]